MSISKLGDLTEVKHLISLGNDLIEKVESLRVIDLVKPNSLQMNKKEESKYHQYRNPKYWENLTSSNRYYHNTKMKQLVAEYDLYNYHQHLTYLVNKEVNYLIHN